ncbi:MAG: carbohydrate ABC transporter permease [Planctomycetota bacterium]|jgi:multiple sugar transport system permease protein|nr:carbohydrate ABC transporter permease [Planctomycetota bacterium]
MPIILQTEQKHWTSRIIHGVMYAILCLGAATMVYPFLLMVSGSLKSRVDANDFDIIPRYFFDLEQLYRKQQESKYSENLQSYIQTTHDDALNFKTIRRPAPFKQALLSDWRLFLDQADMPVSWFLTGYGPTLDGKIIQKNERSFRDFIKQKCDNDLAQFRLEFNEPIENWFFLKFQPERLADRKYQLSQTPLMSAFYGFKNSLPVEDRIYVSCDGAYARFVKLNSRRTAKALVRQSTSTEWQGFVRTALHPQFIQIQAEAMPRWSAFLKTKYGQVENLNKLYRSDFDDFTGVPFPADKVHASAALTDYILFLSDPDILPAGHIYLDTPELRWREFLADRYRTVSDLNDAHGRTYTSIAEVPMPQRELDDAFCAENSGGLRMRYATRNFHMVLEYILLYGRGLWNTVVYCILAIVLALVVNPLAAYALSRFDLPSEYKILLFLIATMAFPGVVTMIPNFLLLRDLGMLNTFAALLLPGMANGYSIFLLKGFFDSLPRELFEAADIDGANEWQKFWIITMNLSKPILAVIALGAFNGAYTNFMYAFILCQDREMWTMMVWLYQLQQFSAQSVVFASLLIAAIPTLLVFVLCQNVIIRGIVVPTEK